MGGGPVGALAPPSFGSEGRRPSNLDCGCRSFLFLFVVARELGSYPKNSDRNPGSF